VVVTCLFTPLWSWVPLDLLTLADFGPFIRGGYPFGGFALFNVVFGFFLLMIIFGIF